MSSLDIRRAATDLSRAFLADLEALPPEDWNRPSDCAGWNVAATVVHQTQVAELVSDGLARGRAGDSRPPARAAEGVQVWRTWRVGEQSRRAAQTPATILADYRAAVADVEAELDRVAEAPPDVLAWHPAGPQPLDWMVEQWLFELALHDWDIRVSADPTADLRPAVLAAFGRTLPSRLRRGFTGAEDPAVAGAYRIELAGGPASDDPFVWLTRVADGHVEIESPAAADATIRTDPSAFGLVMTARRPVDTFEAADRWRTEGDTARAAAFARAFKGY